MLIRPASDEHAEYYGKYVALVPDGEFATVMTSGHAALVARLRGNAAKAGFAYAAGKWTLAESLLHLADAERVFSYRMLSFLRGETTPLPGFDENAWAPQGKAAVRDFGGVVDEFEAVRQATIALVRGAPAGAWANRGTMSGTTATARATAYIIAGHERHHDALFHERYGV